MKHCSKCRHCVVDMKALDLGIWVKKCRVNGHVILHPWFSGFRCLSFRKWRSDSGN